MSKLLATPIILLLAVACASPNRPPPQIEGVYRSRDLPGHYELILRPDSSFYYAVWTCFGPAYEMQGSWHTRSSGVQLVPAPDSEWIPEDSLVFYFVTQDQDLFLSRDRPSFWTRPDPLVDLRRIASAAPPEHEEAVPVCENEGAGALRPNTYQAPGCQQAIASLDASSGIRVRSERGALLRL